MITSSFKIKEEETLKLQEAVKLSGAYFKQNMFFSFNNVYVTLEFHSDESYVKFNKIWLDFTTPIKEVDKRPNLISKFYRRYLKNF